MSKRLLITEDEKKQIKNLYYINEVDAEKLVTSLFSKAMEIAKNAEQNKTSNSDLDSSSSEKGTSSDGKPFSEIKGLNDNENIVLKTLKGDGFTDEAAAAVMGVVGGESGFKTFKETSYKNTSNSRIRAIFPTKLGKMSDSELDRIKQSDEDFFNVVYGGMYGNASDEGYKYVGRGFNGITFKANYEAAERCTGIGFVNNPELMEDPSNAAKALSCYFKKIKDINELEKAFQEAYRQNAGPGHSWEYYSSSQNPVNVTGISKKKSKTEEYYKKIKTLA